MMTGILQRKRRGLGGVQDEPIQEAEEKLRDLVVEQARTMVSTLLTNMNPVNAGRALALIRETAELQGNLLSQLALAGVQPRAHAEGAVAADDWQSEMDSETYGANALDQFAHTFRTVAHSPAQTLASLTVAYDNAKQAGLKDAAAAIKAKIDQELGLSVGGFSEGELPEGELPEGELPEGGFPEGGFPEGAFPGAVEGNTGMEEDR